jgi:hypothetical protein
MVKRLLVAVTAASLALLALPGPAQATHAWNGYHWARTANPFTVELDDNVTSAWDSYLNVAASDWNASSVLNTTVLQGSFGSKRSCTPATMHVEVCNSTYGNTGWLGIASIYIDSNSHITRGYTKMNDTYMNTAPYNTGPWHSLVMCQEVGHTFGLAHQDENFDNPNLGTCMDYTSNPSGPPSNEHPNQHDYDELVIIYSHTDSYNTTFRTGAGAPTVGDTPASWGRLVSGSTASHSTATYVRDLGHGNLVVTFVIWA